MPALARQHNPLTHTRVSMHVHHCHRAFTGTYLAIDTRIHMREGLVCYMHACSGVALLQSRNAAKLWEFDKLFDQQSRIFDVAKRADITCQMERILLEDLPDDRGYYWQSPMGYWNHVKNWSPLLATTVYNYGKFERVWCQGGRCM
jgi:hypothetical protein